MTVSRRVAIIKKQEGICYRQRVYGRMMNVDDKSICYMFIRETEGTQTFLNNPEGI